MRLGADCITDYSIEIPDGMTLDGAGHAIVAVDPAGPSFRGGVVVARGTSSSIVNTTVTAVALTGGCPAWENRLRGIYFDGASGTIRGNDVVGIYRGPSACDEGNAIEVRNRTLDGPPSVVTITGNVVDAFQKTGILVHGRVEAVIEGNFIGTSMAAGLLGANGVQVGPIAAARVVRNMVEGAFTGNVAAGAAVLVIGTGPGTVVDDNDISGDLDVGIHVLADGVVVTGNTVRDEGADGPYDIGIVNRGSGNTIFGNTLRGFRTDIYGEGTPALFNPGQQIE